MDNIMRLAKWDRGIRLESRSDPNQFAFLWFYEWHLFDAVTKGEHTSGTHNWEWAVDEKGEAAQMSAEWLRLTINATESGAELALEITNTTDYDWPAIAAIIPCLNPGDPDRQSERNPIFLDVGYTHTYFRGENGLDVIKGEFPREIHFSHEHRPAVMSWQKEREDGRFTFDRKWPTSERDAFSGILIRESSDGRYVMGIGWESFLSAQGHNPWNCMHLSVRVGPLGRGEKRTIRGRMYLFEGSRVDCLEAFEKDIAAPRPAGKSQP